MILRLLTSADIPDVARLHMQTIASPGSSIGLPYVSRLYTLVLNHSSRDTCFVAVDKQKGLKKERIIGVIMGTTDVPSHTSFIQYIRSPRVLWAVFRGILTKKISIASMQSHRQFHLQTEALYRKPYMSIQSLFVDHQFRRKGIGRQLVLHMLQYCRDHDMTFLYVDATTHNTAAHDFYASMQFTVLYQGTTSNLLVRSLKY